MQRQIARGASAGAGLIFHIFAQDSASTTGAGKASIAYSSWTCYYIRSGEAISGAITPQDITTIGTYAAPTANTNIRIKAVDNTNMIGIYEVQIHADWVNTTNSCQSLTIYLTATGVAVLPIQIPLVAYDPQSSTSLGLSRIDDTITSRASQTSVNTINNFVDTEVAAIKAKTDNLPSNPAASTDIISAATIADAVWDEVLSGHLTAGTTGNALNAAGSSGDPWSTALPGAYGAGTAGKIVGDNLNATILSRASQTSVDTVDDFLDTEIAAIKAKTDTLPATPASTSDIPSAAANATAVWASGSRTLSSFGTLVSDIWSNASRTLSAFGFTVTTDVSSTVSTNLNATVGSRATPADVLTQVNGALDASQTELTTVPTATGTLRNMIKYMFSGDRNRLVVNKTNGSRTIYREDSTTPLGAATFSDNGTILDKAKDA